MNAGVLPVKRLSAAKGRLASALGEDGRKAVAEALLADALGLCIAANFLTWFVVSDDPDVLERAGSAGLETVEDPGSGLNPALARAIDTARSAGADSVSIVPADLPLASAHDLADLLDTGATSDVVVVPASKGGGTNGLYVSPPEALTMSFGDGSLSTHMTLAHDAGLRCSLLPLTNMVLDIDTIEDVDEFLAGSPGPGLTHEVLAGLRRSQA